MTPSDKAAIAEYMGWFFNNETWIYYSEDDVLKRPLVVFFDSNDASLCVQKMVEKGDLEDFEYHVIHNHLLCTDSMTQWLFNPENFFSAMAEWLRSKI